MKIKLIIVLFLLTSSVIAQPNFTSFSKYSYPLIVVIGNHVKDGTGFLYKKNDKPFLISNYHVIKGMNSFSEKIEWVSDTINLKYMKSDGISYGILPIDISENKIGKTEVFAVHDRIDLFAVEIKDLPKDGLFYYINNYIDKSFLNLIPDKIFFYGFPGNVKSKKDIYDSPIQFLEGQYNKGFEQWDSTIRFKFPKFPVEEIEKRKNMFNANYFFFPKRAAGGFSGSPVFGEFTMEENKVKKTIYKFIGVVFGFNDDLQKTWAIQASACVDYFNKLL